MSKDNKFNSIVEIMAKLRSENGCPWDREQTHSSLKPHLIEESYETIEAIESGDPSKLKEELGDVLFQVIFHSRISEEAGEFTLDDVVETIKQKMVRRHPHVFGDVSISKSNEVLKQWENIKSKEKGYEERKSVLDGIPQQLPSLLRAHRIQDRAARVGFDWANIEQVFEKVEEEIAEFKEAFLKRSDAEMEEELGDLLFALVNIARFIEVNPEDALRKTITKFTQRFHHIENSLGNQGKTINNVSLDEMEVLWNEAKEKEKKHS